MDLPRTLAIAFAALVMTMSNVSRATQGTPAVATTWDDGSFADYEISGYAPSENGVQDISGSLSFRFANQMMFASLDLNQFYGSDVSRAVQFEIRDDGLYYSGKQVILPLFYAGGAVVADYGGSYENVTGTYESAANLNGGITNGQPLTDVDVKTTYRIGNLTLNSVCHYTYGTNTGLLFSGSTLTYSVLFNGVFNITNMTSYMPSFVIKISKTNIDLGPVNTLAMFYAYVVIALPVIAIAVVMFTVAYLYHRANRRKKHAGDRGNKKSEEELRRHRSPKRRRP